MNETDDGLDWEKLPGEFPTYDGIIIGDFSEGICQVLDNSERFREQIVFGQTIRHRLHRFVYQHSSSWNCAMVGPRSHI